MTNLKLNFGKRLRKLRREKDITQEQLAESLNITTEAVSNIERGIHAPSFATLESIAQALNLPVKALFEFEETDV